MQIFELDKAFLKIAIIFSTKSKLSMVRISEMI